MNIYTLIQTLQAYASVGIRNVYVRSLREDGTPHYDHEVFVRREHVTTPTGVDDAVVISSPIDWVSREVRRPE